MNRYLCFFRGRKIEVAAETTAEAQRMAVVELRIKERQRTEISVYLLETSAGPYTHGTSAI
jgi:hypothetical protein